MKARINCDKFIFYVYVYLNPLKPIDHPYSDGRDSVYFEFEPFYVGKGNGARSTDHLRQARGLTKSHKLNTIRQIWREGKEPIVYIFEKDIAEWGAFKIEEILIALIGRRDLGTGPLVNLTSGGDGASHSEEWKIKHSQQLKGHPSSERQREIASKCNKGKIVSQETRNKISMKNRGKKRSEESKKSQSEKMKGKRVGELHPMHGRCGELNPFFGKTHTDEVKKKISQANTGKEHTQEFKDAISKRVKAGPPMHDAEAKEKVRQKLIGQSKSEEHKKNLSEASKKWWAEHRDTHVVSDETRKKMSESAKKACERRKQQK